MRQIPDETPAPTTPPSAESDKSTPVPTTPFPTNPPVEATTKPTEQTGSTSGAAERSETPPSGARTLETTVAAAAVAIAMAFA